MTNCRAKKRIVIIVLCVVAVAFLIIAAVTGLGYRPRFEKEPFDMSTVSEREDIVVTLGDYADGRIDMKIENNTGHKLSADTAYNVTLLYWKDGAWYRIKSTGGAARQPNTPDKEYGYITFQNSRLGQPSPVYLAVSYGSVDLPDGRYMLLRELKLWEDKNEFTPVTVGAEFEIG